LITKAFKRHPFKKKRKKANNFSLVVCRDGALGTFHRELDRRGIRRFVWITVSVIIAAMVLLIFYSDNLRKRLDLFTLELENEDQQGELT